MVISSLCFPEKFKIHWGLLIVICRDFCWFIISSFFQTDSFVSSHPRVEVQPVNYAVPPTSIVADDIEEDFTDWDKLLWAESHSLTTKTMTQSIVPILCQVVSLVWTQLSNQSACFNKWNIQLTEPRLCPCHKPESELCLLQNMWTSLHSVRMSALKLQATIGLLWMKSPFQRSNIHRFYRSFVK